MYLTEDEAKQKWCPKARVVVVDDEPILPAHNRQIDDKAQLEGRAHCIASACMAWEWCPDHADGDGRLVPQIERPLGDCREFRKFSRD